MFGEEYGGVTSNGKIISKIVYVDELLDSKRLRSSINNRGKLKQKKDI